MCIRDSCENEEQAAEGVKEIMLDKKFGASGNHVVVEEFLTGPEVSVLSFTDGKVVKPMVSSICLLYTSPSPRDGLLSRMPSSA